MYNIKVALEKLNKLNFKESTLDLYRCLLKRFQKFLDSKGITNPKLEIFLDFHKTLDGSSSKMFYSLIFFKVLINVFFSLFVAHS